MKWKHAMIVALVILMGALTACATTGRQSGSNATAPDASLSERSDDKIALTIRTSFAGASEEARRNWLEKYIEKFESENPQFEVEHQYIDTESHRNKLAVEMAGGNPPDLFYTWGLGFSEGFANNGMLLDITEDLNADPEWRDSFLPIALSSYDYGGNIMGVSLGGYVEGIYYRQDLFDSLGLNPPDTYEHLIAAIEAAKKNDMIPIAAGLQISYAGDWHMGSVFQRFGGVDLFMKIMKGEESWIHPDYIRAIEWMQELADMDAFPEGVLGIPVAQARTMFGNGQALMYWSGSWDTKTFYSSEYPEGTADNIGFVDVPALPGGKGDATLIRGTFSPGLSVSSKVSGETREGAVRLLKTIGSKEALVEHAILTSTMPSVKVEASDMADALPLHLRVIEAQNKASGLFGTFNDYMPPGMADVYYKVLSTAIYKDYEGTPEQLLTQLDQAYKDFAAK